MSLTAERTTTRRPCQVCGRWLNARRDGMVKPHKAPRTYEPYAYCRGTGYRHARWEVGQKLRHHTGMIWEVIEDRGGQWGDYLIRCLSIPAFGVSRYEKVGREMVTHAEYMHRHGWEALDA